MKIALWKLQGTPKKAENCRNEALMHKEWGMNHRLTKRSILAAKMRRSRTQLHESSFVPPGTKLET